MEPIFSKADLHIHSKFSIDAFSPIRDIFKVAEERKLDIIAITDHDNIKGHKEAEKVAQESKVKLIKGEEVGTKEGHLVALFIENLIAPKRSIIDTIKEVHKQGGLAIIAHPANPFSRGVSFKTLYEIYKEVDGIELFNASWAGFIYRKKATKLNSEIFKLAAIGGSDAHILSQIGMGYTLFKGKEPSDLYSAIKKRLTKADGYFDLWAHLRLGINQPRRLLKKIWWDFKK